MLEQERNLRAQGERCEKLMAKDLAGNTGFLCAAMRDFGGERQFRVAPKETKPVIQPVLGDSPNPWMHILGQVETVRRFEGFQEGILDEIFRITGQPPTSVTPQRLLQIQEGLGYQGIEIRLTRLAQILIHMRRPLCRGTHAQEGRPI
jgi:hypothetical protein